MSSTSVPWLPVAGLVSAKVYGPVPPDGVIEPLKISLFDAALLPVGSPASFTSASLSVADSVTFARLIVSVVVDRSPSPSLSV